MAPDRSPFVGPQRGFVTRPQDSVPMHRGVEITLARYDPPWPEQLARVWAELTAALADSILSIDHGHEPSPDYPIHFV